jgi:diacylglycerol kinase (ATP)
MSETQPKAAIAIVNPAAGGGTALAAASPILDALQRLMPCEVAFTEGPGHATRLAAHAVSEGRPTVFALGGDGTTHEIVNGLMSGEGPRPRLGMIPIGTGNSFLRDFDVRDADQAVARVARGSTRRCDVLRVDSTDGPFWSFNLVSIGFSAEVGALTNARFKPLGAAGYVAAVVTSVAGLSPASMPYQVDEGPWNRDPVTLLSFSNSKFTGGAMMMAPPADPCDGLVDVIHIGALGRFELLRTFPRIFSGTHLTHPRIGHRTGRQVRFALNGPVDVMVDGEILRRQLTSLTVAPGALEIYA